MKLIQGIALFGATILTAAAAHAAQTSPAPATSSAFHIEIHAADGAQFTQAFRDADGRPIDAASFGNAIKSGSRFTPAFDAEKKVVTLTLQSTAKEGSGLTIDAGERIPDFHLSMLDQKVASSDRLAGKLTMVDFFFADCVGCIEELPALDAYAAKHPDMNFLAVTFDDRKIAETFVRQRHFGWPVAYEGKSLIAKLGVTNFPTMLLLDAHGNLLANHTGSMPVIFTQPAHGQKTEPSKAESTQLQLNWLDHWVASAVSHKD